MDSEHDECVDALNRLASNHSRPNLHRALDIIKDHFAHEEKYMQQKVTEQELKRSNMMSFSSASDALKTHAAEHSRFLRMMQDELKKQRKPSGSFVAGLLDEFATHIVQFDNYGPTVEDTR